jgi:hypothetical protein
VRRLLFIWLLNAVTSKCANFSSRATLTLKPGACTQSVAVIVLHLVCPPHSLPAAMAVPPSKKRSKITEPMLLRISAAPLCQNKQHTHVKTNRIVFSFLSPRMMGGKERAKYIRMYETFQRSLYNNLLKRFSGLYIGMNTKTCASDCMLGPTPRGWALLELRQFCIYCWQQRELYSLREFFVGH